MSDIVGRIGNLGYDLLGLDGIVYLAADPNTLPESKCGVQCVTCSASCTTCNMGCSQGPK